jgi:hypothetical protein
MGLIYADLKLYNSFDLSLNGFLIKNITPRWGYELY